jgi:hypothetical protein
MVWVRLGGEKRSGRKAEKNDDFRRECAAGSGNKKSERAGLSDYSGGL